MAATGVNLNWSSVTFASTPITKITGAQNDHGGGLISFSGDNNIFPIVAAVGINNPTLSFTTGDVGAAEAFAVGASGTLVATLADAKAATGGSVIYTATNAYVSNVQSSAQHAQFASATVSFLCISSDGATNPVIVTRG
jgi:hypothetical protein